MIFIEKLALVCVVAICMLIIAMAIEPKIKHEIRSFFGSSNQIIDQCKSKGIN